MIKQQMSRTRKVQLDNLLGNTLQYPSNDGLVRIKIVKWDDFVVIEVADTGIGVASNSAAWSSAYEWERSAQNNSFKRFLR
jgi:signal transduction histidine kinase